MVAILLPNETCAKHQIERRVPRGRLPALINTGLQPGVGARVVGKLFQQLPRPRSSR